MSDKSIGKENAETRTRALVCRQVASRFTVPIVVIICIILYGGKEAHYVHGNRHGKAFAKVHELGNFRVGTFSPCDVSVTECVLLLTHSHLGRLSRG